MSAIKHSRNVSTLCESNMPPLDVPALTKPLLDNYDGHMNNFIQFLRTKLDCLLIYHGPEDVQQHILQRTVYACSVYYKPKKIIKDVIPVMIGSQLDVAIRRRGLTSFGEPLKYFSPFDNFQELDIGLGFFIINGFLRHVPYFYTSDPTNTHVVQKKIVRVYSYTARDRGKELNYYVGDANGRKCGDVVVVQNDGTETLDDPFFFSHCPYPVHLTAYMNHVHRQDLFDIDHLGNKIVISPGHLFTKLFIKYLYGPLRDKDWKAVKSKTSLVRNSIETGNLLHVLSRKTVYFKESHSAGKMTNEPQESHREIGSNGEVFIEKSMGCYRETSMQTYPLNPYTLYVITRQLSQKVKYVTVKHPSYEGFFCLLGTFEMKNVGRTTVMVRGTAVSTCDDLDLVYHESPSDEFWSILNLVPQRDSPYFVVVNEACIPVTRESYFRIDLFKLKLHFGQIECYERGKFIVIRYKMGLIMKRLPETGIWVTPTDIIYWTRWFFGIETKTQMQIKWGYGFITSYLVDLNYFFRHTTFLKVILAFNALKNSVLATDRRYALYFMDTVSAYVHTLTKDHKIILKPKDDGFSEHFALILPHVMITYMSLLGCTQEDCIVKRADVRAFDLYRFFTLRFKLKANSWVNFYPVSGDVDEESDLLGTVVSGKELEVDPCSIHVRVIQVSPCEYRLHFCKFPFRVLQHFLTSDKLMVSVEQEHISSTGDKLCSLHGQKGVIRVLDKVPLLDESVKPDLVINPYCMFRGTPGQIRESEIFGGARDATRVRNSDGLLYKNAKAMYGKTIYFPVLYLASEHLYAPERCNTDRVMGQAVKGRSRGGGMKIGNMEVHALRGNGIASCFEQKFFEDGDRVPDTQRPTVAIPKSVQIVAEDARIYKFNLDYECVPSIQMA